MSKLIVFNNISVDGFFTDKSGSMSWAHRGQDDPEFNKFVEDNASGGGQLLLGRVTYELMVQYWPTETAAENDFLIYQPVSK